MNKNSVNRANDVTHDGAAFEKAVKLIKKYESMHTVRNWPYVGYGHRVKKGDNITRRQLSESEADKLLRKDLHEYVALFKDYGKNALLLAVLAYNIGPYKLLGHGNKAPSPLLKAIENGRHDIRSIYESYSTYRGRPHKRIHQRRVEEFETLYRA